MSQPIFHRLYHLITVVVTYDGGHGRIETRVLRVISEITWVKEHHSWLGLQSILAVTATRESDHKVTEETRNFLSSLSAQHPIKLVFNCIKRITDI